MSEVTTFNLENKPKNLTGKRINPLGTTEPVVANIQIDPDSPKARLKAMRDKDREKVKGIFRFYELPGGTLEFVFNKYKDDPVEKYKLTDGHICEIPLGVAKHLNKNGAYPVHQYRVEEDGKSSIMVGKKVRRFGFQSLDFIDESDFEIQSNIIISPDNFAGL